MKTEATKSLQFVPYQAEQSQIWELILLLSDTVWEFHVDSHVSPEQVAEWIREGVFSGDEVRTFWVRSEEGDSVGLIRIHDLNDRTAMFDLRLQPEFRGHSFGRQALKWLTDHVFQNFPNVIRLEGQTRQDNQAMRHVLRACGYVKEAHYRASWPLGDGHFADTVCYGMLRNDWQTGGTTLVHWQDEE